jgi:hypothetical protein
MNRQDDASPTGNAPDTTPRQRPRRTSHLLRDFVTSHPEPRISLAALRDALGDRGFGVLLFIFALPNLVPVNIPLLSAVLGLPLVLLAAQLTFGRHKPWFPRWLTERLLRPRLTVLLSWTGERLIGLAILILALVLALPIPFANWLPACAIAIIGLAIVEKDGLAVLVGLAVGVASLAVAAAVVIGLIKAFLLLFSGMLN